MLKHDKAISEEEQPHNPTQYPSPPGPPAQDWTEDRVEQTAEAVKKFAGFNLFVGNIPLSVSEKVSQGIAPPSPCT